MTMGPSHGFIYEYLKVPFLSLSWPVKSLLWEKPMFPKPIKILCPQEQHCFKCSPLSFLLQWHNHLYTQFIVNVTFRIIDYRISLGETLKMNSLSLLATYGLICQRENSGSLAPLGTSVVFNTLGALRSAKKEYSRMDSLNNQWELLTKSEIPWHGDCEAWGLLLNWFAKGKWF